MKLKILLVALAAAAFVPASMLAGPPTRTDARNAAQLCANLRAAMPAGTFALTYRNFGQCVSTMTRTVHQNGHNAAQRCKTLRQTNPTLFTATYGPGANAYGKCVSTLARTQNQQQVQATVNAAKACKTLRQTNPTLFTATYGPGANAFGKCVSTIAKTRNP